MTTILESKVTLEQSDNVEVVWRRSWFSWRKILIMLFVFLVVFLYFCLVPARLIISPETTLITRLKPDGMPDYVGEFLLEHNSQLTNHDDNGLRMVIEKFGPYVLEKSSLMRNSVWEDLPNDNTEMGNWYREKWIPLCNAMSIDPTKKPAEYKPISRKIDAMKNETKDKEYKKHDFLFSLTTKSWRAEDYPDIAEFVREAEEVLTVFAAAAKKPQWICYEYEARSMIEISLSGIWSAPIVCNDFAIRANERISRNDIAGAFDDALAIIRIGRHITKGSTLSERLTGFDLEIKGIRVIQSILTYGNPSVEQIHQFIKELDNLPKADYSLDKIIKFEKMAELEMLFSLHNVFQDDENIWKDIFKTSPSLRMLAWLSVLPIDYNIASKRMLSRFNYMEEIKKETDYQKRKQICEQNWRDVNRLTDALKMPQETLFRLPFIRLRSTLMADYASRFMLPAIDAYENRETRVETLKNLLRVSFALELYQRENGQYPDKLEAIAPKYISVIPNDIFTSKELTYKKNDDGYILYSFGQNGIDDNGTDGEYNEDIVVERKKDSAK
ncbi:MAG: hypothetical protein LBQ66_09240 [Planctomycetaceae bacterium]|jgi:hypothetical protein|nr:hypothetical protein [Planctomycetaceae bacterium]